MAVQSHSVTQLGRGKMLKIIEIEIEALSSNFNFSGTRVLVTLIYALQRIGKKKGIASLCVGGGMGVAMAVELA